MFGRRFPVPVTALWDTSETGFGPPLLLAGYQFCWLPLLTAPHLIYSSSTCREGQREDLHAQQQQQLTQLAALDAGAPVDLLFQSIAGTQAANASFGITLDLLREGRQRVLDHHDSRKNVPWIGTDVMYFETGQGSALSAEAHHGIDQLTLEARAYGVARTLNPFLVNSVVGFIGPEYLFDERQIIRAGLEDHFMGKLIGLPMGVDVCYTNHAAADQNSADNLLVLLAGAGCNYFMGVPCSDDVMLNYQSTSYHDAVGVRQLFNRRPAPEFAAWLEAQGIFQKGVLRDSGASPERWISDLPRLLLPS